MNEIHARFADQGLVRPRDGRVLGGVIAGLGRRFGIDPWPARLLFVLILLVIPGSQILIYPLLWILMPSEETVMQTRNPADPAGTARAARPDDSVSHHPPTDGRPARSGPSGPSGYRPSPRTPLSTRHPGTGLACGELRERVPCG